MSATKILLIAGGAYLAYKVLEAVKPLASIGSIANSAARIGQDISGVTRNVRSVTDSISSLANAASSAFGSKASNAGSHTDGFMDLFNGSGSGGPAALDTSDIVNQFSTGFDTPNLGGWN